jgi:hypothetical protein
MVLLALSCGKNGDYPSVPDLTFKSIGPSDVYSGDSLAITCGFKDKEGDINGDSIFFRANNAAVFAPYQIPNFPQQGNLQGDIILVLQSNDLSFPAGPGAVDTVYFDVYIRDRRGHISDTVRTTPVLLHGS